tara:strand:- start:1010 stop:1162 length:153 start_codon:yes stop_codon:yes gene_type:complete
MGTKINAFTGSSCRPTVAVAKIAAFRAIIKNAIEFKMGLIAVGLKGVPIA